MNFVRASEPGSAVVNEQHVAGVDIVIIIIIIATIVYCTSFTSSSWAKRLYTTVNAMVCDSGPVLNATAPINGARVTDSFLVDAAAHELSDDFDAVELGRNYFSTVTDAQVDTEQLVENALDSWKKGNSSLSQLLLAKATRLGCAYKLYGLLSRDDIKAAEVLCTYDHRFYEGTLFEEGKPCDKKSDCTTYGNRSVCRPKQHLCAVKHYNTFLEK